MWPRSNNNWKKVQMIKMQIWKSESSIKNKTKQFLRPQCKIAVKNKFPDLDFEKFSLFVNWKEYILQGSSLWIFGKLQKQKNIKGGTLVKCVIVMYLPFLTHQKMNHRKGLVNSNSNLALSESSRALPLFLDSSKDCCCGLS